MDYFHNITDLNEAKLIYRRLAMLNHPDLGGNPSIMAKINLEYNRFKKSMEETMDSSQLLAPGDFVMINGSKSTVLSVSKNTFIARSKITNRQAVFSLKTGICTSNSKFRAEIPKSIVHAR